MAIIDQKVYDAIHEELPKVIQKIAELEVRIKRLEEKLEKKK